MVLYTPLRKGWRGYPISYDVWLERWHRDRSYSPHSKENIEVIENLVFLSKHWKQPKHQMILHHGFGKYEHIRFSRGMYIDCFPKRTDWKNAEQNSKLTGNIREKLNFSRIRAHREYKPTQPFAVCFLSNSKSTRFKNEAEIVKWATESKIYTIFKPHPQMELKWEKVSERFWDFCEKRGFISKYTELLPDGYNPNDLISKADLVCASDSSLIVNAILAGKPCFTTLLTPFSDIIPQFDKIPTGYVPKIIPQNAVNQFITWYYHVVCTDMGSDDWMHHLIKRRKMYDLGMTDAEVLDWEQLKRHGIIQY